MVESQRLASLAVSRVLAGSNLNQVLENIWAGSPFLTSQQRGAIQDLSYGTLRFLGRLDALIGLLTREPPRPEPLRCLLLVALYQLEYGKTPPHTVVNSAVTVTVALNTGWAKGLVNAVLRNFLRRREELLQQAMGSEPARFSYPQWWIDKLRSQYPEDFQSILDAGNLHPPFALRTNRRRLSVQAYLAMLHQQGMNAEIMGEEGLVLEKPVPVDKLPGFREGLVSVQDIGAQIAAPLLDVRNSMRVLDACAAPGGKTAHLLEIADIELTALDSDEGRIPRIHQNLDRLGLSAKVLQGDAADTASWWDGRPFDRILCDAPCSASGVVRRHPDIKWLRRSGDIPRFASQQQRILEALWQILAIDGKLLYATCSVFAEENQLLVNNFLERHRDARPLPLQGLETRDGQLLPDSRHDGFFYALFNKT